MTLALLALLALPIAGLAPVGAAVPVAPPVVASENVELLFSMPDVGAISTAFDPARPVMYVNTLNGISTYDISNPALPVLEGVLPMPHFQNESMTIGRRSDGTTFVLVGVDVYSLTPTGEDPADSSGEHVIVVDVTDPAAPEIVGQVDTGSSTHTVQCVTPECTFAYTSGAYDGGEFHLLDLTDLSNPREVEALDNIAGEAHQWDLDDVGLLWASSGGGLAAYDVSDPFNPVPVQSTNASGSRSPYNDFILHNSLRPNAEAFEQILNEDTGRIENIGSAETATPFDGNVALVTEEDYVDPTCGSGEGMFSTWYVPYLDAEQFEGDNRFMRGDRGKMVPLDTWNTELLDTGRDSLAGAVCSAHYFTFHDTGFVAQGWYQQGTRILDVRDPRDIKQVGYFYTGASETWHAYWVPERDENGVATGTESNIVYTNDAARGIDVLRVTLPTSEPERTEDLTAPILPQWLRSDVATSAPTARFGYACRQAGTLRVR